MVVPNRFWTRITCKFECVCVCVCLYIGRVIKCTLVHIELHRHNKYILVRHHYHQADAVPSIEMLPQDKQNITKQPSNSHEFPMLFLRQNAQVNVCQQGVSEGLCGGLTTLGLSIFAWQLQESDNQSLAHLGTLSEYKTMIRFGEKDWMDILCAWRGSCDTVSHVTHLHTCTLWPGQCKSQWQDPKTRPQLRTMRTSWAVQLFSSNLLKSKRRSFSGPQNSAVPPSQGSSRLNNAFLFGLHGHVCGPSHPFFAYGPYGPWLFQLSDHHRTRFAKAWNHKEDCQLEECPEDIWSLG